MTLRLFPGYFAVIGFCLVFPSQLDLLPVYFLWLELVRVRSVDFPNTLVFKQLTQ